MACCPVLLPSARCWVLSCGPPPAEVLGVRQAYLRSMDAAGAVSPQRTPGGHHRYSRRQLAFAARIRELLDQGHTLAAVRRIVALEDDLAAERVQAAAA